ncbi:SH3 domain-containing protein [Thiothrix eikelboomii]|uniref:SH3 domain-containing protein n=1 Tax=Thiothrix eikelboomii TaxID=92487 RepID=A0A1T4X5S5_9GAMM|nr:SH3 domain-containing protein [Thiothrix eikelboomii]SKA84779.1 SH3 domain-containing protein [Thiothrix eikelboomii]
MQVIFKALTMFGLCLAVQATPSYAATNTTYQAPKIIAGAGVRVRANPKLTATEVGKLAFGTVVVTQQRSPTQETVGAKKDYWYSVNTPLKGWVFGGLLQDYDAKNPDKAAVQLIRSKLGKPEKVLETGVLNFNEALEVSQFAQSAATKAKSIEAAGELKLAYLQAVQQGLYAINPEQDQKPPYSTWVKSLGSQVFYHELAGGYYVDSRTFWKLADQYKAASVGDVIAWQAAHAALGGECEGFVECMSYRGQITAGEYLKRYPKGRYVIPMLEELNEDLAYMAKEAPNQRANVKEIDFARWDKILAPVSKSPTLDKTKQYLKQIKAYQ